MADIRAELVSKELITDYLGMFRFRLEQGVDASFLPGQYVTLGIRREWLEGKGVKVGGTKGTVFRPYSVASAPSDDLIELYIAWVRGDGIRPDGKGMLTTELFDPAPDVEYLFKTTKKGMAKGKFTLPDDDRDIVMVSTGTGIAPFRSMLRENTSDRRFILLHGVAHRTDVGYHAEFTNLENKHGLNYIPLSSRDAPTNSDIGKLIGQGYVEGLFMKRDKPGRVTYADCMAAISSGRTEGSAIEAILGGPLSPDKHAVMLCGNPGMLENIELILESKGFSTETDVISEQYWVKKRYVKGG